MAEVIPPVLEPTEALMGRLQTAERQGWTPFSAHGVKPAPLASPRTRTPLVILQADPTRLH